jgi:type IV pilus assembly protein PilV
MTFRRNHFDHQTGLALIETLITIIVVALSLLGILAILINGLKLTSSSSYRTIAAAQAQAIAEKLRANPSIIFTATSASNTTFTSPGTGISNSGCIQNTGCTASDFVPTSLAIWREQLAKVLPNGSGTICQDTDPISHTPTPPNTWNCNNPGGNAPIAIKICWNEARVKASAPNLANGWLCVVEAL